MIQIYKHIETSIDDMRSQLDGMINIPAKQMAYSIVHFQIKAFHAHIFLNIDAQLPRRNTVKK